MGAALTRPGDGSGADAPSVADLVRIERALGWRPTRFRPAAADRGEGGTAARWIVAEGASASGRVGSRSAFVKIGATSLTAEWTRVEHANYRSLRGWFLPEVLGFDDDGARPVLALEDLSGADWPPPWTDARVTAVLAGLDAVHRTTPPGHLIERPEDQRADWEAVAADPEPFLRLGLCSRDWLEMALPTLTRAAGDAPLGGNALIHLDIRSDNLCFRSGCAVILDWNHAQLGNPDWDVAFWLPSLHDEGGPPPESILPDAPGLAAWVAGYFCARAGEPPIPEAPHVRPLQVRQSRTSLAWDSPALWPGGAVAGAARGRRDAERTRREPSRLRRAPRGRYTFPFAAQARAVTTNGSSGRRSWQISRSRARPSGSNPAVYAPAGPTPSVNGSHHSSKVGCSTRTVRIVDSTARSPAAENSSARCPSRAPARSDSS